MKEIPTNTKLMDASAERMVAECGYLIRANKSEIWSAMVRSLMNYDGDSEFRYRVNLHLEITPRGNEADIGGSIYWSVKYKDKCEKSTVDADQPELFNEAVEKMDEGESVEKMEDGDG